jgi:hypothetical protein
MLMYKTILRCRLHAKPTRIGQGSLDDVFSCDFLGFHARLSPFLENHLTVKTP